MIARRCRCAHHRTRCFAAIRRAATGCSNRRSGAPRSPWPARPSVSSA